MKVLKFIAIGFVSLIVLLVLVAFALPSQVHVERSTVIAAPAAKIFPHVNSMKKFKEWSPWTAIDPNTKWEFSGPEEGVGSAMKWTSDHNNVGSGSQKITKSELNKRVESSLDFGDQGTAVAFFQFDPDGDKTKVTWGFDTDLGMNPIGRWMGLMMDSWVGGDYERGLQNLKKASES